jgi:uroporphyrinogen III methyltransferase / synthase
MSPAVLVVRSGSKPFPPISRDVELRELVSHTVTPVATPPEALEVSPDFVVFTSQPAVARVAGDPRLSRVLAGSQVAAVGEATAEALRHSGVEPAFVAAGSAASLLSVLPKGLGGKRCLLPCAEDAGLALAEALARRGATVERVVVYRRDPSRLDRGVSEDLLEHPVAAFCATAPSAAAWLFGGLSQAAARLLRTTPAVALGPATRRRLESLGVVGIHMADPATFESAARLLGRLAAATPRK